MQQIKEHLTEERVKKLSRKINLKCGESIYYDYSKTHYEDQDIAVIKNELFEKKFKEKLLGMRTGKKINFTENRSVLHYLLRSDGSNLLDEGTKKTYEIIKRELEKMKKFESKFDSLVGITGKPIKTILNIGIGGSDLGPKFINNALSFYKKRDVLFFSNVDPGNLLKQNIDLETTLVIVVSKTFTTMETLENAKIVFEILKSKLGNLKKTDEEIINTHFVAVTAMENPKINNLEIKTVFSMWDFVGGHYSLWSSVGLSIVLGLGFDNFKKLLNGALEADNLFFEKELDSPAGLMAITEIFYRKYFKSFNNKCIVAYDTNMELLYKYLQQAEMESNGKPGSGQKIIWGGVGTDVQHSFFQMLHQNEENIYLEVLFPVFNLYEGVSDTVEKHHQLLIANCMAQTRALMLGEENTDKEKEFKGNKPSTTIVYSKLTPEVIGFILATYEHKIFTEGIYWGINSFDQFGVTLGKKIAKELYDGKKDLDKSSMGLIEAIEWMHIDKK